MINHGSGMFLCLKSVSNKLTSFVPFAAKTRHVIPEKDLPRHLSRSPFLREFYNTSVTTSSPPVIETSSDQWCAGGDIRTNDSPVKSTCARFSNKPPSRPIQLFNSNFRALSQRSSKVSDPSFNNESNLTQSLGVPCTGTQDDIVLVNSPVLHYSKPTIVSSENAPLLYSDLERQMILLAQSDNGSQGWTVKSDYITGNPNDPPTAEQIEKVRSTLANDLPQFFVKPLTYTIYHPTIEFENNIQGKKTKGIYDYVKQAAYLRTIGHIRFIYIKYEVMKITGHPEDGTVKVRWKINIMKFKRLFKFWQMKIWDWSTIWDKVEVWHDGFSTYYVRGDGLVYKHVADRMMPDQELLEKKIVKAGAATETLYCAKTPNTFHILYNPSKNVSNSLELNGF